MITGELLISMENISKLLNDLDTDHTAVIGRIPAGARILTAFERDEYLVIPYQIEDDDTTVCIELSVGHIRKQ